MSIAREEPYRRAQQLVQKKKYAGAFAIYEELANAGDPQCQVFLGWMWHNGLGTQKDTDKALAWFARAGSLGSKEGAFYCGKSEIARGHHKEAITWFQQAAAKEYGPALLWLGLAHIRGIGMNIDVEKGVKYLQRAAETGNFPARRELSVLMISGRLGVSKIPIGLLLFPYALVAALVSGILEGNSPKLMG